MDRELMFHDFWRSLTDPLLISNQGAFMHVSWLVIAALTVVMTLVSVGRILPSRKARRIRKLVKAQTIAPREVRKVSDDHPDLVAAMSKWDDVWVS